LNSSRLRQRIQIDGDKFFAKLPAAGPETSKILHSIRKSRYVKSVQKFEFDPYLCDRSEINHLRKICHKLKDIAWLNLVLRRVDFPSEIETLAPFVSRFSRLRSIRIELPRTQNIDENGFIQLYKAIGSCSHLRSCEWRAIEMPERSKRLMKAWENYMSRPKWLQSMKFYETLQKGALKNSNAGELKMPDKIRDPQLRSLDVTLSSAGEWANKENMTKEKEEQILTKVLKIFQHLEKVSFHIIKTITNFEETIALFGIFALVPTLSHVEYEYLNCQISDMDVLAFAHSLTKITHLKSFSLKVIQKPGITEDCIEKLGSVLSKLDHLPKFDVYFRRLGFHPRAIKDLGRRIETFGNIQCSCCKESIHLYRRNDNE